MIPYREKVLKQASGLEYWAIKLGLKHVPGYECQNIGDFLENQASLRVMEEVLFQQLRYFPQESTAPGLEMISLQDEEKRRMNVYVRPYTYDEKTGEWLYEALRRVNAGEMLHNVVVSNGTIVLDESREEAHHDKRVYLESFVNEKGRKLRRKGLRELVAELIPVWKSPTLEPIPIKR